MIWRKLQRKPNKSVRFYPSDWYEETADLTRLEWALLLEVCVFNWGKRGPMPLARLYLPYAGEAERAAWASLVRKQKVYPAEGGWIAHLVTKMVRHNSLLRLPNDVWSPIRTRIFERDGYACQYCGTRDGRLECDHRIPLSRGGSDHDDNLVTACLSCNRSKGARTPEEMGWV